MTARFLHRHLLTNGDWHLMDSILGNPLRYPDLVIAPAGETEPYIYRWHLARTAQACLYFHIQVASDPARPLHDHPWDNTSVILSGGYDELWEEAPWILADYGDPPARKLRAGDMVFRKAEEAHRLLLPEGIPYAMTLFTTGPKRREWGFWYEDGWRPFTDVTATTDGVSVHVKPEV